MIYLFLDLYLSFQDLNFEKVETTIAARNTPVLNLYSKLNFRFHEPEMTFHWANKNDFDS